MCVRAIRHRLYQIYLLTAFNGGIQVITVLLIVVVGIVVPLAVIYFIYSISIAVPCTVPSVGFPAVLRVLLGRKEIYVFLGVQ